MDAQPVLQQDRQLHPSERIQAQIEAEIDVQVERLVWVTLAQQGPNRVCGRVAQQRCVFWRQGVDGTSSASRGRLGIEHGQQEAPVFPETGSRQWLIG